MDIDYFYWWKYLSILCCKIWGEIYRHEALFLATHTMEWELLADQPLWEKLIKKWGWLYFFMLITAPVGYIIRVIISNKLWVADVWLFYSVLWFILLLSIYHDLWLTEALQYFLPRYWIEKKYSEFKSILVLTLVAQVTIWFLIACAIYFGADRLAIHHFRSVEAAHIIRILCRYFIGVNFLAVFNTIYTAFQDTIASSLTDFSKSYSILAFTLIFWLGNTLTDTTFSVAWISWLGISLVVSSIIFLKKYRHTLQLWKIVWDPSVVKTQLKYAFWVFLWANVWTLLGQVDQQLIVNFLGPLQAWYYANFFSLVGMYSVVVGPILTLIFPIVTEIITKQQHDKLSLFQNILYRYFSVFALSIGWLFFAFGPEISTILFGTKFMYSGQLLIYVWPFLIFNVLTSINYGILAWLGKVRERVIIIWWALLVNVLANVILILGAWWWLMWAIIALVLWWLVLWWFSFRIVHKHEPIHFEWTFFWKNLFIISLLSSIYYFFKSYFFVLDNSDRFGNVGYILIAGVLYYGVLSLFNLWSVKLLVKEIKNMKK